MPEHDSIPSRSIPEPAAGERSPRVRRPVGLSRTQLVGFTSQDEDQLSTMAQRWTLGFLDPPVQTYSNATIPVAARVTSDRLFGGVFDERGAVVVGSQVFRGPEARCVVGPAEGHSSTGDIVSNETVIYGGMVIDHFGHILLECLPRAWYAGFRDNQLPIYVQFTNADSLRHLRAFYGFLGMDQRICPIQRSTRFANVVVPEPAFVIGRSASPAFKAVCLRITERILGSGPTTVSEQPVYLSRSRLSNSRRPVFGEELLEQILEKNGIKIVHTQELDLAAQIRLINSHRTIMGSLGTAFHLLLFSGLSQHATYFTWGIPEGSYLLCDVLNGTQATYVASLTMPAPFSLAGLSRARLPVMFDAESAANWLKEAGLIHRVEFDGSGTAERELAYERSFIEHVLSQARDKKDASVLRRAESLVETKYHGDAALRRQLERARQACHK